MSHLSGNNTGNIPTLVKFVYLLNFVHKERDVIEIRRGHFVFLDKKKYLEMLQ